MPFNPKIPKPPPPPPPPGFKGPPPPPGFNGPPQGNIPAPSPPPPDAWRVRRRQEQQQQEEGEDEEEEEEAQKEEEEESDVGGVYCTHPADWTVWSHPALQRGKRPGDLCSCCALLCFGFFIFVFISFAVALDDWMTDSRGDTVGKYNAAVDVWTTGGKADEYAARWAGAGALPPPALMVQGAATNFTVLNNGGVALGVLSDPALDYKRYRKVGRCGASR